MVKLNNFQWKSRKIKCQNQREASFNTHTLHPSPQILPIKTSPPTPLGSLGFLSMSHPFSLLGPAINLSLLQIPTFWFIWLHCVSGTQTLVTEVALATLANLTPIIFNTLISMSSVLFRPRRAENREVSFKN